MIKFADVIVDLQAGDTGKGKVAHALLESDVKYTHVIRYNGGGSLAIAKSLCELIAGKNIAGKVFQKMKLNDKLSSEYVVDNFNLLENISENSLNLSKVVVLTTKGSASASEAVIATSKS